MVEPEAKRENLKMIKSSFGLSERRCCILLNLHRSTCRYKPKRKDDDILRSRLKVLSEDRRRFGYKRLHTLLVREGFKVNHKKVYRIYKEEGLVLRRKRKLRKYPKTSRVRVVPSNPMDLWSIDFVSESLYGGRRFRAFTIVDTFTRECPWIEVGSSLTSHRIIRVLNMLKEIKGLPKAIVLDNGPEFTSKALDNWAYKNGVKLDFIRPGRPVENAYIESFNGKFRDECLNENWFTSMKEAKEIIEEWRIDYNTIRPHSSLNQLTPYEFIEKYSMKMAS